MKNTSNLLVGALLDRYPAELRAPLKAMRKLILTTAASLPEVGPIQETLKWNEPAYVTPSGSGTTIRIAPDRRSSGRYAMFVHCQTNLIHKFRKQFPNLEYQDNRAIVFDARGKLPEKEVRECIKAALLYHSNKKKRKTKS